MKNPLNVFLSYSHEDERFRDELEKHLAVLKREALVSSWHDRKISPGAEWESEIDAALDSADIILLLISADYLASDYCYSVELKRALERHEAGQARVIPIILRPVDWSNSPFARFRALPRDGKPVSQWRNRDEALADVASSLRTLIQSEPISEAEATGVDHVAETPTELAIEIYIDPGSASTDTIQNVLDCLSDLHIAAGGLGLEFVADDQQVHAMEGVAS